MTVEKVDFFVHETAIVEDGAQIGKETRIWHHSHVRAGSTIGQNCNLGKNVYVDQGVSVGDSVKIQNNVSLYQGISVADAVFIGPSAVFTNDLFPRSVNNDWKVVPTTVETGASIGANATIVCGVTIGPYATVAAGAVITRDVSAHSLVAGVPGRSIGTVCGCGVPTERDFDGDSHFFCESCAP